ncbi:MAG: ABC transporter permease [Desulfurococcales archaeon]|nr:ABC transporter permease [Desulfurococcales archaeon]
MLDETLVLTWREVRKWLGRRGVLVSSLVTPLVWIALFGKSFNLQALLQPPPGSLPPGSEQLVRAMQEALRRRILELFGTTDYFTFMASGMLVVFSVFQGMFSGVSVIFDKRLGYMERLLSTPTPRPAIFLSRVLATLFRVTVLDTLLLAAALAMGMHLREGVTPIDLLAAWAYVLLLAAALSAGYATLSFYAEHQEVLFAASNLINLPLMFSSNALFPLKQMPDWLQAIAKANPVTHAASLVRHHLIGAPIDNYTLSLAYLTALTAALLLAGLYLSIRWMENR